MYSNIKVQAFTVVDEINQNETQSSIGEVMKTILHVIMKELKGRGCNLLVIFLRPPRGG